MAVSHADVRHVASLARLGLAENHVARLVGELNGILAHMDVLRAVIDDGTAPLASASSEGQLLRPDVLDADPLQRTGKDLTPHTRDGFFLVPRLDAHEDTGA